MSARVQAVAVVAEVIGAPLLEALESLDHYSTSGSSERVVQALHLRAHIAEAVVAALEADMGLTEEHQSVPVDETGERWMPRTREQAERTAEAYPPAVMWPGSYAMVGIVRIDDESRLVTRWTPTRKDTTDE